MVTVESKENVAIVSPSGELGHRQMVTVKNVISELLRTKDTNIVLDLGGVEHINHMTVGVLVERRIRLRSHGGDLRLARPSDYLVQILRFAGVHDHFEIHASVETAIESYLDKQEETVLAGQNKSGVPFQH